MVFLPLTCTDFFSRSEANHEGISHRDIKPANILIDDRKLAYTKVETFSNLGLITLNRKGDSKQLYNKMLTRGTSRYDSPTFSPNGKKIAFTLRGKIFVMPSDGGEMQLLTFMNSDCIVPRWSPDGQEVAFISNGKVWKIPAKGGTPSQFIVSNTVVKRHNLDFCKYHGEPRNNTKNFC